MKGKKYLEFLRYCLDDSLPLPESSSKINWMRMMDWAESQAIVGIIYGGIQKAGAALNIPFSDLMEWIGYAQNIENQNRLVNKRCAEIVEEFRKDGFECCILKGQGNAMMYPNPMLRMSGDIDIWLMPKSDGGCMKTDVRGIIKYVRKRNPGAKITYHHIDYGEYKGAEVEVHYRPSFLNNLIANRRLQAWLMSEGRSKMEEVELPEGVGSIPIPSWEFNVVFQLSHIYRHVIQSGLGLRQMIDYYYLLKSNTRSSSARLLPKGRKNRTDGTNMAELLKQLGLMEIAGAVMWVLKEVLGLEEKFLIAPVDERRGRFLLDEIMEGGNFGMGLKADAGWLSEDTAIGRNILRLKRDARLLRYFPSECLWEPIFRIWHFFWRMMH